MRTSYRENSQLGTRSASERAWHGVRNAGCIRVLTSWAKEPGWGVHTDLVILRCCSAPAAGARCTGGMCELGGGIF